MKNAIFEHDIAHPDLEALQEVAKNLNIEITPSIMALFDKEIIHDEVINKDDIESTILKFINN
jgi:threonine synthase